MNLNISVDYNSKTNPPGLFSAVGKAANRARNAVNSTINEGIANVNSDNILRSTLTKASSHLSLISKVSLTAGVALAILGLCFLELPPVAIFFVSLSALAFFVSYNSSSLSFNAFEISRDSETYRDYLPFSPDYIRRSDLKKALAKDTFGVTWFINRCVEDLNTDLKRMKGL